MSDTVAVMKDGVIVQEGAPADIYGKPAQSFVADFIGKTNLLPGQVMAAADNGGLASVATPVGLLHCRLDGALGVGDAVTLAVRPEHVALSLGATESGGPNAVAGEVAAVIYLGNLIECTVMVGAHALRVQLHPSAPVAHGARVQLALPIEHCLAMRH